MGDDGTNDKKPDNQEDWKTTLGDLAKHERMTGINSLQDLAKAYVESPSLPKLPTKVDEYTLPDTVKIEGLRTMALENKFTQEQLDGLIKFHDGLASKALKDEKERRTKAEEKLKTEWGDKYKANLELAKKALKHFDGEQEGIADLLKNSGMANDPKIIKFLHKLSGTLKEGEHIGDDGNVKKPEKSIASRLFPNHPVQR